MSFDHPVPYSACGLYKKTKTISSVIVVCMWTCGSVDRQNFFSCIAYRIIIILVHLLQSNTTDQSFTTVDSILY